MFLKAQVINENDTDRRCEAGDFVPQRRKTDLSEGIGIRS